MYNFYDGAATVANWNIPSPQTFCYWLILRGYNATTNRFSGSADNYETKYLVASAKYQADFFENTGTPLPSSPGGTGTRIHLAFAVTANGTCKSYLNGVLDATSGTVGTVTTPATLGIGGRNGSFSGQCANGDLEDIRVYNRELSAQEILNLYGANGLDCIYDGLLNRWALTSKGDGTEISTDPIYDLTTAREHLAKATGNIYYRGGFITPRRRV